MKTLSKSAMYILLVEDFERMFPDANRATKVDLYSRLNALEVADLELLVSQLPKDVVDRAHGAPKYTPGPWILVPVKNSETPTIEVYEGDTDSRLASVYAEGSGDVDANARLIAAAPEMLVEIERYLSIAKREGWHATVSELEKLIAKATGGAE